MAPRTPYAQDRLVRKETQLGVIRAYEPPRDHIGLRMFAPLQDVATDDVIFQYLRGLSEGMAPARAEDAESEMARKDDSFATGRASIIDWAIKDHYDPSDVTRYWEALAIGGMAGETALPLTQAGLTDFQNRVARDTRRRRRMLDNRLEWLIMTLLDTGKIEYNDGKVIFTVNSNRADAHQDMALPSGHLFGTADSDPIGDFIEIQEQAGPNVDLTRCVISRKAYRKMWKSEQFLDQLTGQNPLYKVRNWNPEQVGQLVTDQTGIEFIIYDSVYTTRPLGSNVETHNRFTREDYAILLPSEATVSEIDDMIGFGKTLTSPHPEGDWTSGFYEWEKDTGPDPWGYDMGIGIKAFPVMPHLDKTRVVKVI